MGKTPAKEGGGCSFKCCCI